MWPDSYLHFDDFVSDLWTMIEKFHDPVCLETKMDINKIDIIFHQTNENEYLYFYQIKDIHFLICDLHKTVLLINKWWWW